jgi:hypothetical protein
MEKNNFDWPAAFQEPDAAEMTDPTPPTVRMDISTASKDAA